jgi:hypothetical protein
MNKAQELFDAPVHVLYIARCQRELGQWVEAADTFRQLSRRALPAGAPAAFTNAVNDGVKELAELEPRIPRVVVNVTPADAPELQLWLGEQPVSTAAVGVERPQNPGHFVVKATASGFVEYTGELDVSEGQVTRHDIELKPAESAPVVAVPEPEATANTAPPPKPPPSGVGLLLGLRLGAAFPAGQYAGVVVHPGLDEENVRFSSMAKAGVELELRLGVHFLNRIGAIVFLSHDSFGTKNNEYQANIGGGLGGGVTATARKPTVDSLGVALLGGAPRGTSGPFVELGLALVHSTAFEATLAPSSELLGDAQCSGTVRTTGTAGRLGVGWNIPLRDRLFHLMPYIHGTLGGASDAQFTGECSDYRQNDNIKLTQGPLHSVFTVGLGGDFMLGG